MLNSIPWAISIAGKHLDDNKSLGPCTMGSVAIGHMVRTWSRT